MFCVVCFHIMYSNWILMMVAGNGSWMEPLVLLSFSYSQTRTCMSPFRPPEEVKAGQSKLVNQTQVSTFRLIANEKKGHWDLSQDPSWHPNCLSRSFARVSSGRFEKLDQAAVALLMICRV
jgi:hypothetical protein